MTTVTGLQSEAEDHMKKAIGSVQREFGTVRTGRANSAILDRVEVDYYGTATPLKNLANVSVQEGRTLVIQPYDKTVLKSIEQSINKAELGLVPNSDGTVIRINVPSLTEERRKDLVKQVKKMAEDGRVAVRNVRRHTLEELKKLKGAQVSEDEIKRQEETLQKTTDKFIKEIDKLASEKEADIMEI